MSSPASAKRRSGSYHHPSAMATETEAHRRDQKRVENRSSPIRRREYHLPDVSLKVAAGRLTITELHRETGRVTLARGILQVDGRGVVAIVNVNGATLMIFVAPSSVPDQPRKRRHVTVQFTKCVRQCSSEWSKLKTLFKISAAQLTRPVTMTDRTIVIEHWVNITLVDYTLLWTAWFVL